MKGMEHLRFPLSPAPEPLAMRAAGTVERDGGCLTGWP